MTGGAMVDGARNPTLVERLLARRSALPLVAFTVYLAVAAMGAKGAAPGRVLALGALAVALAVAAVRTRTRWELWGLSVVVVSVAPPAASLPWLDALGLVAATLAIARAASAVAAAPSPASLVEAPRSSGVLAMGVVACVSAPGVVARGLAAAGEPHALATHASAVATWTSALAALGLLAQLARVAVVRRLAYGVGARVRFAAAAVVAATVGFAALAALGGGAVERGLRLGMALSACIAAWIAVDADAHAVARVGRRVTALTVFGGPVAVLGGLAASDAGADAPAVALVTALVTLAVGAWVDRLERPFRPANGALLDATRAARTALQGHDPREVLRLVLVALREPAGVAAGSPELWTCDPARVATIDTAGYLRERAGVWPDEIVRLALREPEATLRADALARLEVRRPDLRPSLQWMRERGALCATAVVRDGEPEGLLVVLDGNRGETLTWEEARALKNVADGLAAACHTRSALARGLDRERALQAQIDETADAADRVRHESELQHGRDERMTNRLARPATVGIYSVASRTAYEAVERRVRIGAPVAVVAPSGVDVVPYLARAHLAGPRAHAPFVLVDGTASREHDLERWRDAKASPLALAHGGLLVLLDGAALPADVQRLVARALAERRPPWEDARPLDVALALTSVRQPRAITGPDGLDEALAAWLADAIDAPIDLPGLRDRSEDLRAIVTDRLAREGLRVRGRPVGIDDAAFARLVEHDFPGEDAELGAMVQRLVASAAGDVVRAADVDALGLERARPAAVRKGPRSL
jgi:hypothetical protein